MFRHVRNALTHNRVGSSGDYPLIVSKYTLDNLKQKIKWMTIKAIDKCIKISNIEFADLEMPLYDAIFIMNKENYSYLPIFENGKVKYIISEKSILTILVYNEEGVLYDKTVKVKDYCKYFELDNNPNEYYDFIDREQLLYDLREKFNDIKDDKKCGVLFITEKGKKDESILGMVTLWDIAFFD